jgi:hypothetical protein
MGQLVHEHSQVSVASIRQEHPITQGYRSIAAGQENELPNPSGCATAGLTVQPDP